MSDEILQLILALPGDTVVYQTMEKIWTAAEMAAEVKAESESSRVFLHDLLSICSGILGRRKAPSHKGRCKVQTTGETEGALDFLPASLPRSLP